MAVVGGMLASAIVKEVMRKLGSAIRCEFKLRWNFKRDLEEMKDMLESIEAVLEDAERRSVKEKTVRLWLRRLKIASYDVSDMLDELEDRTTELEARKSLIKIPNIPKFSITMVHKMKKMRIKLNSITEQYQSFGFKQGSISNEWQIIPDKRETSSEVEEAQIIGRIEEKKKIFSCLSNNMNQDITILPIYGIGGIGKTTLAQLILNDSRFKDFSHVWIYVSQMFDVNKIGNSIISQVSKIESQLAERERVRNCLGEVLADRKVLIILDDLWEGDPFELDKLKAMLNVGNGSKVIVIVTTRDKEIANKICTTKPYKLLPLADEIFWAIMKQKSDFEARPNKVQLEPVGREIALKCGGVALAAQALGHMLRSRKYDEWVSVRDNAIWNNSCLGDKSEPHSNVLASLMLSYNCMPPKLKLCFAYCATFAKGQKIVKDDLIYQWISLDIIEAPSIFSTWQHGENYFRHLMGLSFLQHSNSPCTAGVNHEDVKFYTMHDLVHDLATLVMVDELLDAREQVSTTGSICRYALLNDCSKPLNLFVNSPGMLRALHFMDCAKILLHSYAFSSAKHIRAMDLSKCYIQKLPDSIGQLKQLRYLSAPGIQDKIIPICLTRLSKLIYLKLCGSTEIIALPESIGEMEGLMYLDLSGCSKLRKLPQSFGKLTNLVHLDLSYCSSITGVSGFLSNLRHLQHLNLSYCQSTGVLPGNLVILTELQYLNLSCSSFLSWRSEADVLSTLTKLEYLNLSSEHSDIKRLPEPLGSFIKLKYLNFSGCAKLEVLPKSCGELIMLEHLDLSQCCQLEGIPDALGGLIKLKYLNLSCCFCSTKCRLPLKVLQKAIANLFELRYLYLSECLNFTCADYTESYLEKVDCGDYTESYQQSVDCESFIDSLRSLPNLEYLDLSKNGHISRIPESIGNMDSLIFISVAGCKGLNKFTIPKFTNCSVLSLPQFVVQAWDKFSSNLFVLHNVSPTDLEISRLENVKAIEEAMRIRLMEKQSISMLKLDWTRGSKRNVEDQNLLGELVPPRKLKVFSIEGYSSGDFPAWLMAVTPLHFPCLVRIDMVDLPKCTILPPLGQLPTLNMLSLEGMQGIRKIDGSLCGGAGAFPRLWWFSLCRMESLEEWHTRHSCGNDGVSEFMFPNLDMLEIQHCPKLSLKPCAPKVGCYWKIESSDDVVSSWQARHPCSPVDINNLIVTYCKLPLHQWKLLHHINIQDSLTMESCDHLSSALEINLQGNDQVTSLQQLDISQKYPELLASSGVKRELASLQSLRLSECESMASLPEWLGDLSSLLELKIYNCPNLKILESMQHLTSLQSLDLILCNKIQALPEGLGALTSLKKLRIDSCRGIKSLPESMQKLTNLDVLRVCRCPELQEWCESEKRTKHSHVVMFE